MRSSRRARLTMALVGALAAGSISAAPATLAAPAHVRLAPVATVDLLTLEATTPRVSGTAVYGGTLTALVGTWTYGTAFTYQWYADGVAITGATAKTLTLGTYQKGKKISVAVTGAKDGYASLTLLSAATARVITAGTPTISGTPVYGGTLTAKPGYWTTGTTLSYRWYADGTAITGAYYPTLKLGTYQKNKRITVKVTGKKDWYATASKTSTPTLRVQTAPTPTISGTRQVGYTLTAITGTWAYNTTFSYQWYADGVAISGATSKSYVLSSMRAGDYVKVKVTGRKDGYPTISRTSSSVGPIASAPSTSYDPPSSSVYYANCDEARAAGAAPLYIGEPGYRSGLDRDGDGVACEG